jgi:hypothetical protein
MTLERDADINQPPQNDAPSEVKLIFHHQFHGIELVSPTYASRRATCHLQPDQNVDDGSITQAGFKIMSSHKSRFGVVMYRLQRKNTDLSNVDAIPNEEETCTQLVTVWKINRSKKFSATSYLLEHDKDRVWDDNRLLQLARDYNPVNIQYNTIEDTWLTHDRTVLTTILEFDFNPSDVVLNIAISEGVEDGHTKRPERINLKR